MKIYTQITPNTAFSACTLGDCNIVVDEDNFIRFDLLGQSGPYRLKLEWEKNGVITSVQWTQELNPLAATGQDMAPSDMVWSHGNPCLSFSGLSLTTRAETLIDGKNGGDWHYSVGFSVYYNGGNPAVDCAGEYPLVAHRTSLYFAGGKALQAVLDPPIAHPKNA